MYSKLCLDNFVLIYLGTYSVLDNFTNLFYDWPNF